ncbi:tryptophan synthase subunit alpha [Clostridium cylindrosporum]|uniref:Tryptophan synthase alpha chain n=1 Tax=Clostridium cylindrosporum DSM 605 TaxID=1121307 RepID=A0A0J8D9E9_CLOCY|nr:tryptophan synthase subunit alpha [Clostridium cylindrosporum]KMT20918.1 tryptophan synthase alpha chain TrpA [Clostridium cylindrosporum DSM 605]
MSKNRIESLFETLKEKNKKAFVAYLMSGENSLEKTKQDVLKLEELGADLIELGVPFSDPAADGEIIQKAGIKALKNGVSIKDVLSLTADIRKSSQIPIVIMTYLNPILSLGVEEFFLKASEAGVDGVIIPDVPIEESSIVKDEADKRGISFIPLVTLTSTVERIEKICNLASGFVYSVNILGVTGKMDKISSGATELLQRVKSISSVPVLAGFGVSTPEKAREMKKNCDGVIVGSQIIKLINENKFQDIKKLIDA